MEGEMKKGVGYDFKTSNTAPTAYKCLICHLLIRSCTELPCGHSYCRECLERWEELKIQENKKLERFKIYINYYCFKFYFRKEKLLIESNLKKRIFKNIF